MLLILALVDGSVEAKDLLKATCKL
jgi:hypothetical protein